MEITDLGRDSSGSMSLCEKMELWSKADSEHSGARPEPDAPQESHFVGEVMLESEADLAADDQLSGVADDGLDDSDDFEDDQGFQDDDGEAAGHLSYMKLVLDNPSYDWLLSSFKKEMLLTTSSLELFPGGESIRSKILNRLPTGVISTRESPRIYEVQYEVSWDLRAFLTRPGLEDSSGIDLDNTITINGSGRSLQAIPCCHYVWQTWPSHGKKVLRLLQKSLAGEPEACFSGKGGPHQREPYHCHCRSLIYRRHTSRHDRVEVGGGGFQVDTHSMRFVFCRRRMRRAAHMALCNMALRCTAARALFMGWILHSDHYRGRCW